MVTSPYFWLFLFGSVAVYWNLPRERTTFLAAASYLFLCFWDAGAVAALTVMALAFYYAAPYTRARDTRGRWVLAALILGVLSYLSYFKYFVPLAYAPPVVAVGERLRVPQFFDNGAAPFLIPLGVSYFTFKLIHYAVEVARGRMPSHDLKTFFLYLFLHPIFTAGPIERFEHFVDAREKTWSRESTVEGLTRILYGLIKKFFVAEYLLLPLLKWPSTRTILEQLGDMSPLVVWWHCSLTFVYAYMEFAGYTDIAIGGARLYGFNIAENFNWPLAANSISDFWSRWHRTLAAWCQSYIYFPIIGATRNVYLAMFLAWGAIGLWHAGTLNWLCWGLYHAVGIVVRMEWRKLVRRRKWKLDDGVLYAVFCRLITLMFVAGSYTFIVTDRLGGMRPALMLLAKLVGVDLAL